MLSIILLPLIILCTVFYLYKKKQNSDMCSICWCNLNDQQIHKLECGHKFHTECIIKWFRYGTNKDCPYCRDNPIRRERRRNVFENAAEWERDIRVRNYLDAENPDKETIIGAYYLRDLHYDISINNLFNKIINQLDLNPEKYETIILNTFINNQKQILKEFRETKNRSLHIGNLYDNFNEFYEQEINSNKFKMKIIQYNNIKTQLENNDHMGIYRQCTIADLLLLGW